ncbi:hypothetical protein BCR36DRAFT_281312 [Piromyces finnis]|uniref:Cyclin-like domain-containing protein n=1 Tax=Piromyces finnis TaxID=1754191 RepID=A0A1Y1VHG2_9FUNG|nr:hypothetical protein BCR36DRAFT_281312 [Piromyces finnis]|eukprot:ORX55462.1 hypothetical protein BCR36DRAFT_281312 [Piromyces finnis]
MKSESQCQNNLYQNNQYYPYNPKSKSAYDAKLKQRTVNKNVYQNKYVKSTSTPPSSATSTSKSLLKPKSIRYSSNVKSPLSKNLDNVSNYLEIIKKDEQKKSVYRRNSWLYTKNELQSIIKSNNEDLVKAIQFIKIACSKLNLRHHVLAAASIFLQRFYLRKSIKENKYQDIASACIFLACKNFESKDMRHMEDIVNVCAKLSMKDDKYLVERDQFGTWKRNIIHNEMVILQTICYDLNIELPSTYIKEYTETLNTSIKLKKYIYCIINDCLTTTLCLRHRWNVIVAAALYVASKMIGEQINCKGDWWSLFSINQIEMKNIIGEILSIYQSEVDCNIPDRRSPMNSTHLNVMSPPLSNPHPSQVSSLSTSQLKKELDKTIPYSNQEKGMIPNVGSNQIPPSPTLSETSEISISKKLSRKISMDTLYNEKTLSKKGINL